MGEIFHFSSYSYYYSSSSCFYHCSMKISAYSTIHIHSHLCCGGSDEQVIMLWQSRFTGVAHVCESGKGRTVKRAVDRIELME